MFDSAKFKVFNDILSNQMFILFVIMLVLYVITNSKNIIVCQVRNLMEKSMKKAANSSDIILPLVRVKVICDITVNGIAVQCDLCELGLF